MSSRLIVRALLRDEKFARTVLPHLKGEYFKDRIDRSIYEVVDYLITEYGTVPTPEMVANDLAGINAHTKVNLTDEEFGEAKVVLQEPLEPGLNIDWLIDETEKFCRDEAVYNAVYKSMEILQSAEKTKKSVAVIPQLMQDAVSVSFESKVGLDVLEDAGDWWELQHADYRKFPCDIDKFNIITRGGFREKTLTVFLAGVHVGKTMVMCHLARSHLLDGKDVLYITLEMSSDQIASRVYCNLLNRSIDDLESLPKSDFVKLVEEKRAMAGMGKLVIQEFPTANANVMNFRHLLHELKLKKNWTPDLIYVDYVNLMTSVRIKDASDSYTYVQSITQELRGLAVERGVPVITGTQLNRSGAKSSDPEMTDTAESWGLPATADVIMALVRNKEMDTIVDGRSQIHCIQLKNRIVSMAMAGGRYKRFSIGVDVDTHHLFNLEDSADGRPMVETVAQPVVVKPEGRRWIGEGVN